MYSPALERFLQRDPLGYVDGMNLFAYVGNNAVNMVDPWGLMEVLRIPGEVGKLGGETGKATGEGNVCKLGKGGKGGKGAKGKNGGKGGKTKPTPKNFKPPTNPPQYPPPPESIPPGWRIRTDPPDDLYPYGHWHLEKPMDNGGWQQVDPRTMKPSTKPEDTHIPFPPPDMI